MRLKRIATAATAMQIPRISSPVFMLQQKILTTDRADRTDKTHLLIHAIPTTIHKVFACCANFYWCMFRLTHHTGHRGSQREDGTQCG